MYVSMAMTSLTTDAVFRHSPTSSQETCKQRGHCLPTQLAPDIWAVKSLAIILWAPAWGLCEPQHLNSAFRQCLVYNF